MSDIKKKPLVKNIVLTGITNDKTDAEIVGDVKAFYPNSSIHKGTISWYRSDWFKQGVIGPEHAPKNSVFYKKWKRTKEEKPTM